MLTELLRRLRVALRTMAGIPAQQVLTLLFFSGTPPAPHPKDSLSNQGSYEELSTLFAQYKVRMFFKDT